MTRGTRTVLLALIVAGVALLALGGSAQAAVSLPPGFQLRTVFSDLVQPTSVRFASNGLVFVAEKRGTIQVYDGLADTTPTQVVNLRADVFNDGDRGLLGLAVDPDLTNGKPYIYALYARNAALGGASPKWPAAGGGDPATTDGDACPGLFDQTVGCLVSGRLVRIQVDPVTGAGVPALSPSVTTLVDGWCQQFSTHSIGDLVFGANRTLYVSGGDGANYDAVDTGSSGTQINRCDDPPGEGGALRSQDLLTPWSVTDPAGLSGSILRINPDTGAAAPGNPLAGSTDPTGNEPRIIADGLRNPFRFTLRPGAPADDLWIGDVGWNRWEELNHLSAPFTGAVTNFGWPCYEGDWNHSAPNDPYTVTALCGTALPAGAVAAPYFSYFHTRDDGPCFPTQYRANYEPPTTINAGASITGVAFHQGAGYPAGYDGGLFIGDYARGCLWYMDTTNGIPDRTKIQEFGSWDASNPLAPELGLVDLEPGPGGDIYVVDIVNGRVRRLQYGAGAHLTAPVTRGGSPLTVSFSAAGSVAPTGQTISGYDWDFDGNGTVDLTTNGGDLHPDQVDHTYLSKGVYKAHVNVRFSGGDTDSSEIVTVLVDPPKSLTLTSPLDPSTVHWSVGDQIVIAGKAKAGATNVAIPANNLHWSAVIRHCGADAACHSHQADSQLSGFGPGNTGSSGILTGPDHAYPSYVELQLTATDPAVPGLSTTSIFRLDPATVNVALSSSPGGRTLTGNAVTSAVSFICQVIRGSLTTVAAAQQEQAGGRTFLFDGWSDGGALTHTLTPLADTSLVASYTATPVVTRAPAISGLAWSGATLTVDDGAFDGTPTDTTRRWERCSPGGPCTTIPGATGPTYRLAAADVGRTVRAVVTAGNRAGSASATAAATAVVVPAPRRGASVRLSRRGTAAIRARCSGARRCRIQVLLQTQPTAAAPAVRIGAGKATTVAAGRTVAFNVPVSATVRRALRTRSSVRVLATVTVTPAGRPARVDRSLFALLAPR